MLIISVIYCFFVIFSILYLYRRKRSKRDYSGYKDFNKHTFILFTPTSLILSNNFLAMTIIFAFSLMYIFMVEIKLGDYSVNTIAILDIIKNILLIILMILLYWRCICLAEMSGVNLLFAEFIAEL